jgi:hypothetical protein
LLTCACCRCVASPQDAAFEKFLASAEADPAEAEAAGSIALLGELEALAGEVDEYNEMVFPADSDLQVRGVDGGGDGCCRWRR